MNKVNDLIVCSLFVGHKYRFPFRKIPLSLSENFQGKSAGIVRLLQFWTAFKMITDMGIMKDLKKKKIINFFYSVRSEEFSLTRGES